MTSNTVWVYDANGFTVEFYEEDVEGRKKGYRTFVNNENGKPLEQVMYDENGQVEKRWLNKYDEHGHTIETKTLLGDGTVEDVKTYSLQYDGQGNITMMNGRKWTDERKLESFRFEYDSTGNWIRMIESYKGIPTAVTVRELNYFGEGKEKMELSVIPMSGIFILDADVSTMPEDRDEDYEEPEVVDAPELTDEHRQWIAEPSRENEFNAKRYYVAAFKDLPSVQEDHDENVEVTALMEELKEHMDAYELFSYSSVFGSYDIQPDSYVLGFKDKPYLLQVTDVSSVNDSEFDKPGFMSRRIGFNDSLRTGLITVFMPSENSGKRDLDFIYSLENWMSLCKLEEKPSQPQIFMVEVMNNNFQLQSHSVNDDFEIRDLNINYGPGFEQFHTELIQRFRTETRGLVLFHGEPGTGKTYYIRHLLKLMAEEKRKKVIYMPPNMVDHLVDPTFMTFLSRSIKSYSQKGIFCVLLIEDAEPLLAKRQEGVRIQGITNLLNMTDGLLNDMLKLQIICTFNVDLKRLDSALLRPGRLIARKEFKPLSELDANILAQRLGIKYHFTAPATLGEIYAMRKNQNTLVHDVDSDKGASTLIDDLI
jgi:hypothetical protein